MSLTNQQLSALLITYLHNDAAYVSTDYFTYLTLAQQKMVMDSPASLGIKEATLTFASTGRSYILATDFYQMRNIVISSDGVTMNPMRRGEFHDLYDRNDPSYGVPYDYTIAAYNATSTAWVLKTGVIPATTYTAAYWYYWMPAAITNATSTGTPTISYMGFDECLLWAATMIAREPKNPEGWAVARQNYERELAKFREYDVLGPTYVPGLRPASNDGRPTAYLGPHYPAV